jgi:hypothetical protein
LRQQTDLDHKNMGASNTHKEILPIACRLAIFHCSLVGQVRKLLEKKEESARRPTEANAKKIEGNRGTDE